MSASFSLGQLGWRTFYSRQLTLEELETAFPARVASVHRSRVIALSEAGDVELALPRDLQRAGVAAVLTAGDFVLVDQRVPRVLRRLDRWSAIVRVAAGGAGTQAIAANVDTLLVVTSCNQDFNASRLERYLALAFDAGVEPVIVLTKADLCADEEEYVARVREIAPRVQVAALNATVPAAATALEPWLAPGQTVALVGSSGVGKSTLVNTLIGRARQPVAGIREDDGRGRHTTTVRELIRMPGGAWLIDTPGMRELRIGAVDAGVEAAFADAAALAAGCRFRDCRHEGDDGCALHAAVADGRLDERRLRSYVKLQREAARAARSLRERHASERRMGKLYKSVQARRRKDRGES